MANYSYTDITITTNKDENEQIQIDKIEAFDAEFKTFIEDSVSSSIGWLNPTRLQKNDSANQRALYSTADILIYNLSEKKIKIGLQGRWCSPSQLFIDLCKKHKLNLKYIDRENGCNFTHVVIIENGKIVKNVQSQYISALSISYCKEEVFDEIIEQFEDSGWFDAKENVNESLKDFLKDEEYCHLKKALINSKKYKDFLKYAKDLYDRES